MADNLAKLVVRLEAQNSQYIKTLEASEKKMQVFQRGQAASLKQIQQGFTKFGALIQGGGFLIAFRLFANNLERVAEKFKDVDPAARAAATAFTTLGGVLDRQFLRVLQEINPLLDKFNEYMKPTAQATRELEGATVVLSQRQAQLNEALKNGASEQSAYVKALRARVAEETKLVETLKPKAIGSTDVSKNDFDPSGSALFGSFEATLAKQRAATLKAEEEKLRIAKDFADKMASFKEDRVQEAADQEERGIASVYEDIARQAAIADAAYAGIMASDKEVNDARIEQFAARTQAFGDLFVDNMVQAADSGFAAVLDSWVRTLQQMLLKTVGMDLYGAIFGGASGWLGEVGKIFGGGKAIGGPVAAGMPYMVGERGPEMFVPSSAGRIEAGGRGGGVTVNQNISVGAGASRAEVFAAMRVAKDATIAEIRDARRRGR